MFSQFMNVIINGVEMTDNMFKSRFGVKTKTGSVTVGFSSIKDNFNLKMNGSVMKGSFEPSSGAPISQPLHSMEEVESWSPGSDNFCVSTVPLTKRADNANRPKTLVCHDMKGGYQEDRFVQGVDNDDCYNFYHWQYLDEFVYFSHYFVTIPPPGWTNAAHKHGVKMLGTVITEWDDGKTQCEQILQSQEAYKAFVDKLVAMATYYKFDGWLINIENPVKKELLENLIGFVDLLTRRMHAEIAHSRVIWYDSVTNSGDLKWQNELNDLNSCYFDVCDGIFLNYGWKDSHLENTRELCLQRHRPYDAYVGADVFGRGCRGGGGFNTKEALEAAREHKLSVALFANGWVYETQGKDNFTENEDRFWSLLHDHLHVEAPVGLPLVCTFCRGQGKHYFHNGKMVRDSKWSNMSLQSLQPTLTCSNLARDATHSNKSMLWCTGDAFNGGSSLNLSATLTEDQSTATYRLFDTNISSDKPLVVSYTFKVSEINKSQSCLYMEFLVDATPGGQQKKFVLLGDCDSGRLTNEKLGNEDVPAERVESLDLTGAWMHWDSHEFDPDSHGWITRIYQLPVFEGTLTAVQAAITSLDIKDKPISTSYRLGRILVLEDEMLADAFLVTYLHSVDEEVQCLEDGQQQVALTLRWAFPKHTADFFRVFYTTSTDPSQPLSETYKLLGYTHNTAFKVLALKVPADVSGVSFLVQPVTLAGLSVVLPKCPIVTYYTKSLDSPKISEDK